MGEIQPVDDPSNAIATPCTEDRIDIIIIQHSLQIRRARVIRS